MATSNNSFFKVVDFIKDRLLDNDDINTVVFARTEQKDLYEKNIYPIAHINPVAAPVRSTAVDYFTFEVGCFDQRDITDDIADDKWDGSDDIQDNLNITYEALKDLINYIKNTNNTEKIELDNATDMRPLLFNDINILDGWLVTITLRIPNSSYCANS